MAICYPQPEASSFDVIITVDQNFPFQQNLEGRKIALPNPLRPDKQASRLSSAHPSGAGCPGFDRAG
jgi:hypothetical protein